MVLTKTDLQSIGDLIETKLEQKLEQKIKPIRLDMESLKKSVKPIKSIQRTLNVVKKDLNYVIGKYDSRLNHLEKHSSHPPGRISD